MPPNTGFGFSVALFASAQKRVCALTNGKFGEGDVSGSYIYGYIDKN